MNFNHKIRASYGYDAEYNDKFPLSKNPTGNIEWIKEKIAPFIISKQEFVIPYNDRAALLVIEDIDKFIVSYCSDV